MSIYERAPTQPKRVVLYRGRATQMGNVAMLHPIDHPDTVRVSNTKTVYTSPIIKWDADGTIETMNTIYLPWSN